MDENPNSTPGQSANPNPGQAPSQAPTPPPSGGHKPNTGMAVLAYLGILILIPFLTESHKDQFVKFHIKQGLVLIIMEVVGSVIAAIPIFGWIVGPLLWIASVILLVMGIMNAVAGSYKELPVVGKYASYFHF